jgi:hypothetical protein
VAEKPIEPGPKIVRIKNTTRAPLSFQVPGRSIHLLPGQSAEVAQAHLDTAELGLLCRAGTVIEVAPPAPSQAATEPKKEDVQAETAETAPRAEARPSGRGRTEKR